MMKWKASSLFGSGRRTGAGRSVRIYGGWAAAMPGMRAARRKRKRVMVAAGSLRGGPGFSIGDGVSVSEQRRAGGGLTLVIGLPGGPERLAARCRSHVLKLFY
jgi:hypothetical protein